MTPAPRRGPRPYRLLLRLLPREFRRQWGPDMEALLERRLDEAGPGLGRAAVWARAVADVAVQAVAVRAHRPHTRPAEEGGAGAGRAPTTSAGTGGGGPVPGGGGRVEGVRQDLRYAWRALRRAPGHGATVVATLALGIGAPVAVFSVVDGVLLQPPPYRDADELVFVNGPVMDLEAPVWSEAPPVFAELVRWGLGAGTAVSGGRPQRISFLAVEAGFFPLLGVEPTRGRLFGPDEDRAGAPPVAVVSDRYRRTTWGEDASPAGRTVELDGRMFEVVGSLPAGFVFFRYEDADLWIPLAQHREARTPSGLARLAAGVDPAAAAAALEALVRSRSDEPEAAAAPPRVRVSGVRESLVGDLRGPLLVFMGASGLVLLIAMANAANLLLARGLRRRQELAVRRAFGAGRGRLVRQLALEAGLLSAAAAVVGVGLATVATSGLLRLATHVVPEVMDVGVDLRALGFAAGLALLAALGAGLAPALLTLVEGSAPANDRNATPSRSGRAFESGLVGLEMALTLVLLVGSGVLLRTFLELRPSDPGFVVDDRVVVGFDLPRHRYADGTATAAFVDAVLSRLAALPGVQRAEAVNNLPLTGLSYYVPATSDGRAEGSSGRPTFVHLRSATEGYLDLMGITPLRGRPAAGPDEVVVNESAVRRFWPDGASPLGRTFSVTGRDAPRPRRVVGVVPDTRILGGVMDGRPEAFVPFAAEPLPRFHAVLATSLPVERRAVRRAVDEVDPGVPILDVATLAATIAPSNRVPRFQATLVGAMGLLALLMATLGTFAVHSHAAARRTREIGIRVALGADRRRVLGTVLGGGLGPVAAGLGVGVGLSLLLQDLVEHAFFEVRGVEPWVVAGAAAALAASAVLAALQPALRASSVDPATVLRQE